MLDQSFNKENTDNSIEARKNKPPVFEHSQVEKIKQLPRNSGSFFSKKYKEVLHTGTYRIVNFKSKRTFPLFIFSSKFPLLHLA